MSLDIEKLRADTPGTQAVIHFNNAGCSLPVKETIDIIEKEFKLKEEELSAIKKKKINLE